MPRTNFTVRLVVGRKDVSDTVPVKMTAPPPGRRKNRWLVSAEAVTFRATYQFCGTAVGYKLRHVDPDTRKQRTYSGTLVSLDFLDLKPDETLTVPSGQLRYEIKD